MAISDRGAMAIKDHKTSEEVEGQTEVKFFN